jgi:hypothetical protein
MPYINATNREVHKCYGIINKRLSSNLWDASWIESHLTELWGRYECEKANGITHAKA